MLEVCQLWFCFVNAWSMAS